MSEATKSTYATPHLSSLFEPDILTTDQFLRVFRHHGPFYPEERLMFAVLSDAVECFQKYIGTDRRASRKLFNDAEAWINSRDCKWPYSFEYICEVLDLSPDYLRMGLLRWRLNQESRKLPRKRLREPLRYQYRVKHNRVCI